MPDSIVSMGNSAANRKQFNFWMGWPPNTGGCIKKGREQANRDLEKSVLDREESKCKVQEWNVAVVMWFHVGARWKVQERR